MYRPPGVLRSQNQSHQAQTVPKDGSGAARPQRRVTWQVPLPPVAEEEGTSSPPADTSDDISPLSKLKAWQAVQNRVQQRVQDQEQHPPHAAAGVKHAAHAAAARCTAATADVAVLVHRLLGQPAAPAAEAGASARTGAGTAPSSATGPVYGASTPAGAAAASSGAASLEEGLHALADPAVLALATDCFLAEMLQGLHPLLSYSRPVRQFVTPGFASLLGPLQQSCQERLRRTTLPCGAALAGAAACFFTRLIREAGPGVVADGLLDSAATFLASNCRLLNSEVLSTLLTLLATARFQPSNPIGFGNRCVERMLRLRDSKSGLQLSHFADMAEALVQLRCIDGLSAAPLINLAVATARKLEEGQHLALGQLAHLARIMHSVAILSATTSVPPPTLLAATAAWHLLVVRAESMAQDQAAAARGSGGPQLGLALSRMWCASRLLMAVVKATTAPSFRLPDRLGLVSHAAWAEREQRTSSSGLTSSQRRVLAALSALKVSPSKISVNADFLDSVFQISVEVSMRVKSSGEVQRIAILIRDPHRQLLANGGPTGVALGSEAAQECLLKAAGWQVVCLESHSCLCLPVPTLAEELGALMMGAHEASSLRFAA